VPENIAYSAFQAAGLRMAWPRPCWAWGCWRGLWWERREPRAGNLIAAAVEEDRSARFDPGIERRAGSAGRSRPPSSRIPGQTASDATVPKAAGRRRRAVKRRPSAGAASDRRAATAGTTAAAHHRLRDGDRDPADAAGEPAATWTPMAVPGPPYLHVVAHPTTTCTSSPGPDRRSGRARRWPESSSPRPEDDGQNLPRLDPHYGLRSVDHPRYVAASAAACGPLRGDGHRRPDERLDPENDPVRGGAIAELGPWPRSPG